MKNLSSIILFLSLFICLSCGDQMNSVKISRPEAVEQNDTAKEADSDHAHNGKGDPDDDTDLPTDGSGNSADDEDSIDGGTSDLDPHEGNDDNSSDKPDSEEPECNEGETGCDGNDAMVCYNGAWQFKKSCATDGLECSGGNCLPKEPDCGNGKVEHGEVCDGESRKCSEIGDYTDGISKCLSDCSGWDTDPCSKKADHSGVTISGNLKLYHPGNIPGYEYLSGKLMPCTNSGSDISSPYGSMIVDVSNKPVASSADSAELHMERFIRGSVDSISFNGENAASAVFFDGKDMHVVSYGIENQKASNPVAFLLLPENRDSKISVGLGSGKALAYVADLDLETGDVKCYHALALGELFFDYDGELPGNPSDSRLDFNGPVYDGDTVLAINVSTDGDGVQSTGYFTHSVRSERSESGSNFSPGFIPGRIIPVPEGVGPEDLVKKNRNTERASVGDKEKFYVSNDTEESVYLEAKLLYVGDHCEIWSTSDSVGSFRAEQIGKEFDGRIFPLVTNNFYNPEFTNSRIGILFSDLGEFAAGYFSPADFFERDSQYNPYSNNREMVYLTTRYDYPSGDGALSTLTHEFQHLVHSKRNIIFEEDYSSGELTYRWIDEGLAVSSEHLYGGVQQDMIGIFNENYASAPGEGHSLLYWDYYDNDKVYTNYSLAYLFFQYLRIQAGQGAVIYSEIIECTENDYRCVEQVVHKYIDENKSFADFMVDFRLALLLNDPTGPYGFHNEAGFDFKPSYFGGTKADLRGGGAIYINSYETFSEPAGKGSNIRFVGVKTR